VSGPLVWYLASLSQGVPIVAALGARRRPSAVRTWVLVWCAVQLLADALQYWLASRGVRNLWMAYAFGPASTVLALWIFSLWQSAEVMRLTLRLAIVPFLAVWGALTLLVESTSTFSRVAEPLGNLVCLVAAAYTLLARSLGSGGALLRQEWFWVTAGMALYFGISSTTGPLSALLAGSDVALLARAYDVKAVLQIVAMLMIAWGVTCPADR
jgi:hypothetical protein